MLLLLLYVLLWLAAVVDSVGVAVAVVADKGAGCVVSARTASVSASAFGVVAVDIAALLLGHPSELTAF